MDVAAAARKAAQSKEFATPQDANAASRGRSVDAAPRIRRHAGRRKELISRDEANPSRGREPRTPLPSCYRGILIPRRGAMADRKNMTLRLPTEQADELEAVARAEGISVSDAVREAIAEHIARKRKDKAFRDRLRAVMERDREILERLAR